jgi:hypothetical protein
MAACSGTEENHLKANVNLNYIKKPSTFYLTMNRQILHYKRNRLMLYLEKLVFHSDIHTKHVNMVCRYSVEFLNVLWCIS